MTGKSKNLGKFDIEQEAESAYLSHKSEQIRLAAERQSEDRVRDALNKVADKYRNLAKRG